MTLTAADVAEIMRLIEQSKFDELSLEMDGVKLTLRRSGASGGFTRSVTRQSGPSDAAGAAALRADLGATKAAPGVASLAAPGPLDANVREITSPMLGTFYRAPKPGSAPFVEIGSVDEKQNFYIDVASEHVDQMIAPDREPVAIAGHHPHVEIGP